MAGPFFESLAEWMNANVTYSRLYQGPTEYGNDNNPVTGDVLEGQLAVSGAQPETIAPNGFFPYQTSLMQFNACSRAGCEDYGVPFGAKTITTYLKHLLDNSPQSLDIFFADPVFIKTLLLLYSEYKVRNGQEEAGIFPPDRDDTDFKGYFQGDWDDVHRYLETYTELPRNLEGDNTPVVDKARNYWYCRGPFTAPVISPTLLGRYGTQQIHPAVLAGRGNNLVNAWATYKLAENKPFSVWTENEQHLFNLMYGSKGESSIRYLVMKHAIEDSNNPSNENDFKYITQETLNWFSATKVSAVQGVAKQQIGLYNLLQAYIGEEPSLENFAKMVTHGTSNTILNRNAAAITLDRGPGLKGYMQMNLQTDGVDTDTDSAINWAFPFIARVDAEHFQLFYRPVKVVEKTDNKDDFIDLINDSNASPTYQGSWPAGYKGDNSSGGVTATKQELQEAMEGAYGLTDSFKLPFEKQTTKMGLVNVANINVDVNAYGTQEEKAAGIKFAYPSTIDGENNKYTFLARFRPTSGGLSGELNLYAIDYDRLLDSYLPYDINSLEPYDINKKFTILDYLKLSNSQIDDLANNLAYEGVKLWFDANPDVDIPDNGIVEYPDGGAMKGCFLPMEQAALMVQNEYGKFWQGVEDRLSTVDEILDPARLGNPLTFGICEYEQERSEQLKAAFVNPPQDNIQQDCITEDDYNNLRSTMIPLADGFGEESVAELQRLGFNTALNYTTATLADVTAAKDEIANRYQIELVTRLWIDAVNVAARKLRDYMMIVSANVDMTIKYLISVELANSNRSKEDIARLAQDKGIEKNKPFPTTNSTGQVNTAAGILSSVPKDDTLSKDEIKEKLKQRQRNIEQCLLLTNMQTSKEYNFQQIKAGLMRASSAQGKFTIHKTTSSPLAGQMDEYGGRLRRLSESNSQFSKIPNYLAAPKGGVVKPLFQITPEIMSALTPKIRIFKIYTDKQGVEREVEFSFENFVNPTVATKLSNWSVIQKGTGGGIKSFSFSFEGGNPATATKDIDAKLVLFFQSFNELTKTRESGNKKYRYIELLLHPDGTNNQKDTDAIHPNEFMPTDFRIRAEVGWHTREDQAFKDMLFARVADDRKTKLLKKAKSNNKKLEDKDINKLVMKQILDEFNTSLSQTNKTYLLTAVEHDIDFRNDGSVQVSIDYAAYIDTKLRSNSINALSTPQIEAYKKFLRDEIISKKIQQTCTARQLAILEGTLAAAEQRYVRAARGSILKRLEIRNLQRRMIFARKETSIYEKEFARIAPSPIRFGNDASAENKDELEVKFYFLGDILHTILDCIYLPENYDPQEYDPEKDMTLQFKKRRAELEKFCLLLSSFTFTDYTKKEVFFTANIADVPISVKFFNNWMSDNVIKSNRTVYPLMEFLRDLMRSVVGLLTDACINKRVDSSLMFQTGQFMAKGKVYDGRPNTFVDPLYNTKHNVRDHVKRAQITNVDTLYNDDQLPLGTYAGVKDLLIPTKDMYKYVLVYPVAPVLTVTHLGEGKRIEDESRGTYHFQIGSNKGLLKDIKFSKTDMKFLREARYYTQGHFGLLQLGSVYEVELSLFGNTIFYPGMEIFIDPRGFGGSDWDPTAGGDNATQRSVANILGIGGYHTVIKVSSEISSDGFKTTVNALFQYNGSPGSRQSSINGEVNRQPQLSSLQTPLPQDNEKCVSLLNKTAIDIVNSGGNN